MQKTVIQKIIVVGLCIIFLAACVQKVETVMESKQVEIADNVFFTLLPPESFGASLFLTQAAELSYDGEEHSLIFYTEVSPERLVIVGLLPSGTRVFSITYDGLVVTSEGYGGVLEQIKPEYFLADFQLAQWPLSTLLSGFNESSLCFSKGDCALIESSDLLKRTLLRNGVELVFIQYDDVTHYQNSTHYQHKNRNYDLLITTIDVARQ